MRILVLDLGSKLNVIGGQQRIATMLTRGLGKDFDTYYIGYKTVFTSDRKNEIILNRGGSLSFRKSHLSEYKIVRIAYNMLVVSKLANLGIDKTALVERIRKLNPDVIIANSPNDYPLLSYLKNKGIKFKSIYIDHGSISTTVYSYFSKEGIPISFGTGIHSLGIESTKKRFFGFFDMVVALNKEHLDSIRHFTDKVTLINNGLRINPIMSGVSSFKKKYGLSKGDFIVGYVGRLFERQKNVSVLIKAFRLIEDGNYKLLIVGEGPSEGYYRELAGNDKRIIFTGKIDMTGKKMGDVYGSIDALVLPSNWEGLSLTVIEAANYSVPLIISESAYCKDLKQNGLGNLISFDNNNAEQLKNAILSLKNKKIRDAAIKVSANIAEMFTEDIMIKRYQVMLKKL